MLPWRKRRQLLDDLNLAGQAWHVPPWFDDGEALWQVVVDQELEGVVAKPLRRRYLPGERGWIKVKNRRYWKYPLEVEAVVRRSRANASLT